ncbi:MAG: metallophosphoesterase [Candidatus Thermoplasmatota archaeon]
MYQQKIIQILLCFLCVLLVSTIPIAESLGTPHAQSDNKTIIHTQTQTTTNTIKPGEIIDISFSTRYPSLDEPMFIDITIMGNPFGHPFYELIEIIDEYYGIIASPQGIRVIFGELPVTSGIILITRMPRQTVTIEYYPSIIGNHTLKFRAGCHPEKIEYLTVGFNQDGIMYPSIGCPQIISRDEENQLVILLSEQRDNHADAITLYEVLLQDTTTHATYTLDQNTEHYRFWIHRGNTRREDELIIHCSIDAIPNGLYDLYVRTERKQYSWKHAVQIQNSEPCQYTVVHLTDIHIGKAYTPFFEQLRFRRILSYITKNIQPAFILITGDIVDWANTKNHHQNFYQRFHHLIEQSTIPIYTLPGNHERYEHRFIRGYRPYINMQGYHRYLNPFNDYAFEYGNITYICLDSGYDLSRLDRGITPEASGLTTTQLHLLTQYFGDTHLCQIIAMHHPAVNDKNDKGFQSIPNPYPSGNNECITKNRQDFITYCVHHNVAVVLSGHSHKNKVLDSIGKPIVDQQQHPAFIQTASSTRSRNGILRTITVANGTVVDYALSTL